MPNRFTKKCAAFLTVTMVQQETVSEGNKVDTSVILIMGRHCAATGWWVERLM